ncbi:FAD/NAD(P)-binding domain-containing protein [Xylona heveae TC161]|uniref:FAD/NAD(P)-binding domain-containing protein n=1 Tax=Xylona heveae (strain CBS 132557 / TC161) TaxID=1328760 RepID=A0A165JE61_XYLHT|nr:FAD/NAD(P)-binding domain-containing protein [Xylona heveae TC161]KZF26121.1 FAD/NAD(P)-binding domain-containing protein [Xylona heveae TC161]
MSAAVTASSRDFCDPLISERAIDDARPLKVIYIGAGVSGIIGAIEFQKYVPNLDLVIYEKNPEIGGTWYENRYPGCACDIPSHSYQLSYESSPEHWSSFYAEAPEILRYWQRVADKYDVRKYIRLSHQCLEARWLETASQWQVKILNLETGLIFTDTADVFMTGIGVLNEWKWPDIKGLHDYKGELLHSANWDENFVADGKSVAVIGGGSSGIQIVPALLPKVKSMDHYVRGRTWISTPIGDEFVKQRTTEGGNFDYTPEEKAAWTKEPTAYINYRKMLELGIQSNYRAVIRGGKQNESDRLTYEKDMRHRLKGKPEVIEHLLPDFPPLCKRLTPGPGYLEALAAPKVDVVPTRISHIDATGIVTVDGTHRPVDAIVCATGFDTRPGGKGKFPIYGRNGVNLVDRYLKNAETYLGLCTDGFPNFFQSLGPNAFQGAGSLLVQMEATHKYVGQILQKLSTGNIRTIEPKRKQVENFSRFCDKYFQRTVFTTQCSSWYRSAVDANGQPKVTALWPGSSIHAVRALEKVRWEDFEMETADGNDFGWFGNGWTMADVDVDAEGLTWYVNQTNFLAPDIKSHEVNGFKENGAIDIGAEVINGIGTSILSNGLRN